MRKYLILILICALLVVPTFAESYTVDAPPGKCWVNIYVVSNEGTAGTITFQQLNGQNINGSFSYQTSLDVYGYSVVRTGTIAIGSDTNTKDFLTPGQLYTMFYHVPGVSNVTQNRVSGYMDQSKISLWPSVETTTSTSPIIRYTIVSDKPIEHWGDYADISAQGDLLAASSDDWLKKALELAQLTFWAGYDFITQLFYWLKFFFIDNMALVLALFFAVPMAFAAKNSRGNPEKFLRQYFNTLKGFFEFVLMIWRMLLESIGTVIGWFKSWL